MKFAGPWPQRVRSSTVIPFSHFPFALFPFPFSPLPFLPLFPLPFYPFTLPFYPLYCIMYTVYCIPLPFYPFTLPFYPFILCNVYCILYTLYNCIMFNVFYRAHGCLGAGPVSLGPPPLGPWGASQGGVPAQCTTPNPWPALLVFASKNMSILMSIWGRFGVDLGSLLGVIFAPLGAFINPSWPRNRLRTVLSSKK